MKATPLHSTVLVVDDHDIVRNLIVRILETAGLSVLAAETGPQALEILRERRSEIGCVLQDLSMPNMRGEEVILRMNEAEPDLPIVAFSAEDKYTAAERLSGLQVAGLVQKPFDMKVLVELILSLTKTDRS